MVWKENSLTYWDMPGFPGVARQDWGKIRGKPDAPSFFPSFPAETIKGTVDLIWWIQVTAQSGSVKKMEQLAINYKFTSDGMTWK